MCLHSRIGGEYFLAACVRVELKLVDKILYWSPYAYTERLSQITGIQREYPVAGGSETAAANFSYPKAVRTITARRHTYAVVDADTLRSGQVKVRLNGIAAPESGHPLYDDRKRFVRQLLRQGRALTCHLTGEQTDDREVGYSNKTRFFRAANLINTGGIAPFISCWSNCQAQNSCTT